MEVFNIVDDYLGVKRVALRVAEWLRKSVHESGIDEIVKLNWNDVTRRIDWLAEEMVIKLLEEEGYGGIVVTEERGVVHLGDGEENFIFIVDPLDGSNNYLAGIPYASVSIGVAEMKNHPSLNDVVYGIIASVFTEEVYEAKKGAGAYLNGSRLPLRRDFYLGDFILAYLNAEAYDIFRKVEEVIGPFKLRSLGSASLDICIVASGRATAFIDIRARLRITDIEAAQ